MDAPLREVLESWLYVRPRTKEILIGYPFLWLAFLFVDKSISRSVLWFFNAIGSIALISVVNSFCHLHTPLNITLYRTFIGLVLGLFIGCIYLLLYEGIKSWVSKFQRSS